MKSPHNEGGLPRERSRRGKANSKSASALLLELQEHVKGKCYLTHGLEGLIVGFFLHKDEMLECNSGIVVDQVHSLKKRAPWDSCTTPLLSSPILPSCTSQPESPVSFAPCTTCGRRGASKEKKVWVHGLMQRAPRLVGSSREKLESKTYSIFSFCFPRDQ